ncbi:hypothetical protein M5K25_027768 [Dendrobium thyrsiflorum]|uniref:Uncharacterized protein n=1 Tax=Dendrobium thyrsiflorum TaxID=117978 RepID=A0ABD0TUT8_DENTH
MDPSDILDQALALCKLKRPRRPNMNYKINIPVDNVTTKFRQPPGVSPVKGKFQESGPPATLKKNGFQIPRLGRFAGFGRNNVRKGERYLHCKRDPVVAHNQDVVTSAPAGREVVEGLTSSGSKVDNNDGIEEEVSGEAGVRHSEGGRDRSTCGLEIFGYLRLWRSTMRKKGDESWRRGREVGILGFGSVGDAEEEEAGRLCRGRSWTSTGEAESDADPTGRNVAEGGGQRGGEVREFVCGREPKPKASLAVRASHRARAIRPQTATRYCSRVSQRAVGSPQGWEQHLDAESFRNQHLGYGNLLFPFQNQHLDAEFFQIQHLGGRIPPSSRRYIRHFFVLKSDFRNFGSLSTSPPFRGKLRETGPSHHIKKNVYVIFNT